MDNAEAAAVQADHLERYRILPYSALEELIGHVDAFDFTTKNDVVYQIEIQVFWDDEPRGNIRVIGSIDDKGWRAYVPLTDSLIMTPGGTFLGE